jgi:hypothetical protein
MANKYSCWDRALMELVTDAVSQNLSLPMRDVAVIVRASAAVKFPTPIRQNGEADLEKLLLWRDSELSEETSVTAKPCRLPQVVSR